MEVLFHLPLFFWESGRWEMMEQKEESKQAAGLGETWEGRKACRDPAERVGEALGVQGKVGDSVQTCQAWGRGEQREGNGLVEGQRDRQNPEAQDSETTIHTPI